MKNLAILVLLLLVLAARADVVDTLYDARVAVEQRGDQALAHAAAEGLREVLVRVSGQRDIASSPAIQPALGKAQSLLRQFRYESERRDGRQQLYLDLSFSEVEVNRLLSQSALPVWDKNRPRVLAWLVADDVSGRRFVNAKDHPDIVEALQRAARQRGLPLVFPALDIDDMLQLTTGQLWAMDLAAVRTAAARYRSSQILAGRLTKLSVGWIANLAYVDGSDENFVDTQGDSLDAVLQPAINRLADDLARQYAVVRTSQSDQRATIVVSGVREFRDSARLLAYLEGVAVVEHHEPARGPVRPRPQRPAEGQGTAPLAAEPGNADRPRTAQRRLQRVSIRSAHFLPARDPAKNGFPQDDPLKTIL